MTAQITRFLLELEDIYNKYTYKQVVKEFLTAKDQFRLKTLHTLAGIYQQLIEYHLRDTTSGDEGFMDDSEAQEVLRRFNFLCKSNVYIEFDNL